MFNNGVFFYAPAILNEGYVCGGGRAYSITTVRT